MDHAAIPEQNTAKDTRQRILDGAAMLFSEHGYAHGSIRNIAAACGIRGPSFYHHFQSKEEMTAELLRRAAAFCSTEIERVDIAAYGADHQALLNAAIDAHLRVYFHQDRALAALVRIYRQVPPELFLVAREALRPTRDAWVKIIRAAGGARVIGQAEAKAISLFLFGAMNAMADWQERPGFAMPLPAVRQLLAGVVFNGLQGHAMETPPSITSRVPVR
jgi:AcrR family transcriptional regulator